jgi:phage tail-like protein
MKRAEIERLLPGIFQRTSHPGSPLYALLEAMEALQAPSEAALRDLDTYFEPRRAPDAFVPYLAGWVDLQRLLAEAPSAPDTPPPPTFPTGLGRLRELIAQAAFLSQWRGTSRGLLRFLETATGAQGFAVDEQVPGENGLPRPFHLRVRAPRETAPYRVLIERIIEVEKPAYVTYELVFKTG